LFLHHIHNAFAKFFFRGIVCCCCITYNTWYTCICDATTTHNAARKNFAKAVCDATTTQNAFFPRHYVCGVVASHIIHDTYSYVNQQQHIMQGKKLCKGSMWCDNNTKCLFSAALCMWCFCITYNTWYIFICDTTTTHNAAEKKLWRGFANGEK
jgi:hypothetical protein